MKICVDANVLVSFLLSPAPPHHPYRIIQGAIDDKYHLLVSETTIQEVLLNVSRKPYLAARIPEEATVRLVALLRTHATILPEIEMSIPSIVRDVKDDYLIAHAVIEGADLLISGDKDLLVLGTVGDVRIVSPATFVRLLDMGLE